MPALHRSWWRDLRLALGFMTRLPVGVIEGDLAAASWAFPLAGLLVGGVAALIYGFAIDLGLSALIAAALAVAGAMLLTGALHEDGLADFADGLGVRGGPAERLAAMRASGIGSFGTLALIFSVLLRVAALAALVGPAGVGPALISAHAGARALLPWAMHGQPRARADGLAVGAGRPSGKVAVAAPPDRARHPAPGRRTGTRRDRRPCRTARPADPAARPPTARRHHRGCAGRRRAGLPEIAILLALVATRSLVGR